MKFYTPLCAMLLAGTLAGSAQSAIYACGHMRRNATQAIDNLRNSGYTTAILFNVNVEADGSLCVDYNWSQQRPDEAGGIICKDGCYVFDSYQPNYISQVKSLLAPPTSINRIEICIGGWGNGSYGHIRDIVNAQGTGENSILYRNFKALKEVLPEIVAVNNDQEQDYDVATAVDFHHMMAQLGYKTTIAPYTNRSYWQQFVTKLVEAQPGAVEIVYLQTYAGGAGNNPNDWKVLGDFPMYIGYDCESSSNLNEMVSKFENWKANCGVVGGFLWNYNSEARNHNEWATAINRIFKPRSTSNPVAKVFQDIDFGGYGVELPSGTFTQSDLALFGLKARDISSLYVNNGYRIIAYSGPAFDGDVKVWTESTNWVGSDWNDKVCSMKIESLSGIDDINADNVGFKAAFVPGTGILNVSGAESADINVYCVAGRKVASQKTEADGTATIVMDGMSTGLYLVTSGRYAAKVVKN